MSVFNYGGQPPMQTGRALFNPSGMLGNVNPAAQQPGMMPPAMAPNNRFAVQPPSNLPSLAQVPTQPGGAFQAMDPTARAALLRAMIQRAPQQTGMFPTAPGGGATNVQAGGV